MKAPLLRLLLPILLLFSALQAQSVPAAAPDRQARARQATQQRMAHAASKEYSPYDTGNRDIRKAAAELIDKGKHAEAITMLEKALVRFPCDIDFRVMLDVAWRAAGNTTKADQYQVEWLALVDSILESGTGRDYATAFKVISVDEEYSVLRALRLQRVKQALVAHEGSVFDLMTVKRVESDAEISLYFNVDLPKKWLDRQLAAHEKK